MLASFRAGLLAALVASAPALADERPWHLQLQALTDVPLDVGARVLVEGPLRLRLSTSLGVLPGPYADVINDFVVGVGGYNQATAELIEAALQSSWVWRTHLGWRPWAEHGFVFDAGLGVIALGGSVNAATAVGAATGKAVSATPSAANYNVASTLEMVDADLGWEWRFFGDRFVCEASLGFSGTVGAQSSATPATTASHGARLADAFGTAAAIYLDTEYTKYVFAPVVTVAAGYRFF